MNDALRKPNSLNEEPESVHRIPGIEVTGGVAELVGRLQLLEESSHSSASAPRSDLPTLAVTGVFGAFGMSVIFLILRSLGLTPVNVEMALGSIVTDGHGIGTWFLGLGWHLINGIVLAWIVGGILKTLEWSGPRDGAVVGFAYWFVASLMVGAFPVLDVIAPAGGIQAGPFGINLGKSAVYLLIVVHAAFGAAVGWTLGRLRETPRRKQPTVPELP